MYNIRCDTDFGIGKAVIRRASYACNYCIDQLELSWDKNEKDFNQKGYDVNKYFCIGILLSH